MLNFLGFSAQLIAIISIAAIVISCISSPQASDVVVSADRIPCAEVSTSSIPHPIVKADDEWYVIDDSDDATQSIAYSALSMTPPVYVTTIDEPEPRPDDLSCLTIRQLKALCKERRIKGYGNLRKHELVELLSAL